MTKITNQRDVPRLSKVSQTIISALDEWLNCLGGPATPPFVLNASFSGAWKRFFRLLYISVVLAVVVLGIDSFAVPKTAKQFSGVPTPIGFKFIVGMALAAVLYGVYSKLFRIQITPRQSFFCLSFVLLPWLPIFAILKLAGRYLGFIVLMIAANLLVVYMLVLLAKGIRIVTGTTWTRSLLSLFFGVLIVVISVVA